MIRLIGLNIISFFKRMFYSFPGLYRIVSAIPIFFCIGRKISRRGIIIATFLLFFLIINLAFNRIILYVPSIFLLIFSVTFKKYDFDRTIKLLIPFYVISLLYGGYQKIFGYTGFEMGWIYSGLSYIGSENYFLRQDIRPFSFFAGVNEFAIFISIFAYYFLINKKYFSLFISFVLIFLVGSRGVVLASLITLFVVRYAQDNKLQRAALRIIFYSLLIYLFIAVIYPDYLQGLLIKIIGEDSRFVVYGTFNARLVAIKRLLEGFSFKNIFIGLNMENELFAADLHIDNFFFRLLNDFGLIITIVIITLLIKSIKNRNQLFSIGILLSYGLYNDVIPSFYLMFNLAFSYFSIPQNAESPE